MNDEHLQDKQQRQQHEDHGVLWSERKARGELRNSHLEAGREQARRDNARIEEREPAEPPPMEDTSDYEYEAERKARKEADRATMKAEANIGQFIEDVYNVKRLGVNPYRRTAA